MMTRGKKAFLIGGMIAGGLGAVTCFKTSDFTIPVTVGTNDGPVAPVVQKGKESKVIQCLGSGPCGNEHVYEAPKASAPTHPPTPTPASTTAPPPTPPPIAALQPTCAPSGLRSPCPDLVLVPVRKVRQRAARPRVVAQRQPSEEKAADEGTTEEKPREEFQQQPREDLQQQPRGGRRILQMSCQGSEEFCKDFFEKAQAEAGATRAQ